MDKLTFSDQVEIFSQAEKIIGPSGAAWSGMIFCDNSTKFLSWLPEKYNEFCAYSNLAALFQNEMKFIKYKLPDSVENTTSIHTQNYTLDLEVFDAHLKHL